MMYVYFLQVAIGDILEPVLAMSAVKEFAAKLPVMGALLTSKPHVHYTHTHTHTHI